MLPSRQHGAVAARAVLDSTTPRNRPAITSDIEQRGPSKGMFRVGRLVPAAAVASFGAWVFDESLGLRTMKRVHHTINSPSLAAPLQLKFDARTRSPIGCLDWPAGRVLLQWALDHLPAGSTTLEVGSGIGTVSVGLACANRDVVATDVDEEALELLRSNAALNGATLAVSQWDASLGESALAALPVNPKTLTHVIGSDLVYFGGACADGTSDSPGLVATLAALLRAQPALEITLLCIARGPVAVPINADADQPLRGAVPTLAPLPPEYMPLESFEQACEEHGLHAVRSCVPDDTVQRVQASQWPLLRASWWLCGNLSAG